MGDEATRKTRNGRASVDIDEDGELNKRLADIESRETKLHALLAVERKRVHDERQKGEAKEGEISRILQDLAASNQEGLDVQRKLDDAELKLHISNTHRQDLASTLTEALEANRRILEAAFGSDATSSGGIGLNLVVVDQARSDGSKRRTVVDQIANGGPAEVSGKIRIGDTISTIRGLETEHLRVDEMQTLMEGPHGTPITITGTRGKTLVNFAVTLIRSNGIFSFSDQSGQVSKQIDRIQRGLVKSKSAIFFEQKARVVLFPWKAWTNNQKRIRTAYRRLMARRSTILLTRAFDALKDATRFQRVFRRNLSNVRFHIDVQAEQNYVKQWCQYTARKRVLRHLERVLRQQHDARYTRSVISGDIRGWKAICQSREHLQITQITISKKVRKAQLSSMFADWLRNKRRSQQLSRLEALLCAATYRLWLSSAVRHWRGAKARKKQLVSAFDQIKHSTMKALSQTAYAAWIAVVFANNRAMSLSAVITRGANSRRCRVVLRAWAASTQMALQCAWQSLNTAWCGWRSLAHESSQLLKLYSITSRIANRHRFRVVLRNWSTVSAGIYQMRTGVTHIASKEEETVRKVVFDTWRLRARKERCMRGGAGRVASKRRRLMLTESVAGWKSASKHLVKLRFRLDRLVQQNHKATAASALGAWVDTHDWLQRQSRLASIILHSASRAALTQCLSQWTHIMANQRRHIRSSIKIAVLSRRRLLFGVFSEWDGASRRTRQLLRTTDALQRAETWHWVCRVFDGWNEVCRDMVYHRWRLGQLSDMVRSHAFGNFFSWWLDTHKLRCSLRQRFASASRLVRKHDLARSLGQWTETTARVRLLARNFHCVEKLRNSSLLAGSVDVWQLALQSRWRARRSDHSFSRSERRLWAQAMYGWRSVAHSKARRQLLANTRAKSVDHRKQGTVMKAWVEVWVADKRFRHIARRIAAWLQAHIVASHWAAWIDKQVERKHWRDASASLSALLVKSELGYRFKAWFAKMRDDKHMRQISNKVSIAVTLRSKAQALVRWHRSVQSSLRLRRLSQWLARTVTRVHVARTFKDWAAVFRRESYLRWAGSSIRKRRCKRHLSAVHGCWQRLLVLKRQMRRVATSLLAASVKHWLSQAFKWWLTLWRRADRHRLNAASVALFRDAESKAVGRSFRAWHTVSQKEEQLHWSYSASCRVVRKSAAGTAFSEWNTTARHRRVRSRKLKQITSTAARNSLSRSLTWWAGSCMEVRCLGWTHAMLSKGIQRRRLQRVVREWMIIGMKGARKMRAHAMATLCDAHLRFGKLSVMREWSAHSSTSSQLRHLTLELTTERCVGRLLAAFRGWIGWARSRGLLQWAFSGLSTRWCRFLQVQALREWSAEVRREGQVQNTFRLLAKQAAQRWATATMTRWIVFLAGGMDSAAAQAASRAQVVSHQTSAVLHWWSARRVRKLWTRWATGAVVLKEKREREERLGRLALRRRLGGVVSEWRAQWKSGRDMSQLAVQASRCRGQATVARWLMGWVGVVKRGREVTDVGETLAGRQLMATMAGAFLRWRRFALWEAFEGGEAVEQTLGDAVWECVGDRVRPSDAHEWAAKALWGIDGGGAEALCASDLVTKVKVGVAKTVGRWFGAELLSALVRLHRTEDTLLDLGAGMIALKARHARELEQMATRLMELESVLLALLATSGSELSTDPALGLSPSLSRFRSPAPPVPDVLRGPEGLNPSQRITDGSDDHGQWGVDKGIGIGVLLDKVAGAEDVLVKALVPGGLAGRTGLIRQNDVLEAINGERVRGLGLGALYRRMQGREGSPLFLQLARRGCSQLLNAPVRFQVSFVRSSAPPPGVVVGAA